MTISNSRRHQRLQQGAKPIHPLIIGPEPSWQQDGCLEVGGQHQPPICSLGIPVSHNGSGPQLHATPDLQCKLAALEQSWVQALPPSSCVRPPTPGPQYQARPEVLWMLPSSPLEVVASWLPQKGPSAAPLTLSDGPP